MTPLERIGELVAAALHDGQLNSRALQQAIGEHLGIADRNVEIDYIRFIDRVELRIEVPQW
jgi:hypothetical protein